ncbi:hypothetical protein KC19_4G259300 [Ceratodon purpureus]|uniref:Uncharacterized protein n=1 Tax=Ceratodon purpureus TaxID=3225 RepID=A0A8T0ICQ6_CERPU|nr:hypothetical protein KC19_4G259300 [Ceratodon purpureus]
MAKRYMLCCGGYEKQSLMRIPEGVYFPSLSSSTMIQGTEEYELECTDFPCYTL